MSEFTPLREAVDSLAGRPAQPDFGDLKRRATRRGRRRVGVVAAATAAVITGSLLAVTSLDDDRRTAPVEQPMPVVTSVPVWHDARGLHRGDVVEQTPVDGLLIDKTVQWGALALVRSGALYLDPAKHEVWFHPWGGDPRIVGHNSTRGPGGDPNGDTAAWFEETFDGGTDVLVVYDTDAGRVISRTPAYTVDRPCCAGYIPQGNAFLQVSAELIRWRTDGDVHVHDVRSRATSEIKAPTNLGPMDVHDQIEVFYEGEHQFSGNLVLRIPERADERFPVMWEAGRLSPSGNYLLVVVPPERDSRAVIIDVRTGEWWPVPTNGEPSAPIGSPAIAWSYGDIAMLHYTEDDSTEGELLACDATRRTCERLSAEPPFLMPTN